MSVVCTNNSGVAVTRMAGAAVTAAAGSAVMAAKAGGGGLGGGGDGGGGLSGGGEGGGGEGGGGEGGGGLSGGNEGGGGDEGGGGVGAATSICPATLSSSSENSRPLVRHLLCHQQISCSRAGCKDNWWRPAERGRPRCPSKLLALG
jgi:hypothetical protein